jgi:hypothetical protein
MPSTLTVPVHIICRDRLTDLKALVEWLEKAGHDRIIFLDNDSTWPPLLEYLEKTPHKVIYFGRNLGPHCLWEWDVPDEWFIYTDPDVVPHEECPLDAVDHLRWLLDNHDVPKAGLGLHVLDVEPHIYLRWEWQLHGENRWLGDCFEAPVDTTFALYRPSSPRCLVAVRSGFPYEVRHMPWYRRSEPSEEDAHYFARASGASTWMPHVRAMWREH